MSDYSIPPLITALVYMLLGVLALRGRVSGRWTIGQALFCFATFWWQGSWFILFNTNNPDVARQLVRFGYSGIVFLPATFFHSMMDFILVRKWKNVIIGNYVVGLLFLLLLWGSDKFIQGFYSFQWGFYPKAGPLHFVFLSYLCILAGLGFILPLNEIRSANQKPIQMARLRLVWSASLIYAGSSIDFIVNYGKDIYPFGFFFVLLATLAFVVSRENIPDLSHTIRRMASEVIIAGLATIVFVYLNGVVGSRMGAALIFFTLVIVITFSYRMLNPKLDAFLTRLPPFRENRNRFREFGGSIIDLEKHRTISAWADGLIKSIRKLYDVRVSSVLVWDEGQKGFFIRAGVGLTSGKMSMLYLPSTSPLAKTKMEGGVIVTELVEEQFNSMELDEAKTDLDYLDAALTIPISIEGKVFALLNIGPKNNGEIFSETDLSYLENLAGIAQHRLQIIIGGIIKEQQTAEWAHDLIKPFGEKGSLGEIQSIVNGKYGKIGDAVRLSLERVAEEMEFVRNHLHPLVGGKKCDLDIKPHNVSSIFKAIKSRFEKLAVEKGIIFIVPIPETELIVLCDLRLVEHRIYGNLVENALRYTPKGGTVEVGYRYEEKIFVGFVRDTGNGISKEDIPRLFIPGTQLDPQNKGLAGLGLASVKSVIESHNGRVWVESEVGKGSTFFFSL